MNSSSKVRQVAKTTIKLFCVKKGREYVLIQPDSSQVSFSDDQKKGYVSFIDEWVKEINNVVGIL